MRLRPSALLLLLPAVAFSWLAMQAVHEAGHVLHAWISGAEVTKVVLHPLAISRTDTAPRTAFVVWGGPLWGCAIPLAMWLAARMLRLRRAWLFAFFAGFCLIANGAYLASAIWNPVGDALDLVQFGTPRWILIAFGLVTVAAGLWLWNGLGKHFGLGPKPEPLDRPAAAVLAALTVLIAVVEIALSDRL